MTLIALILIEIILGVLLYLFERYFTAIDATAKWIIKIIVIVVMVLIALQAFGLLDYINMPVPRISR